MQKESKIALRDAQFKQINQDQNAINKLGGNQPENRGMGNFRLGIFEDNTRPEAVSAAEEYH